MRKKQSNIVSYKNSFNFGKNNYMKWPFCLGQIQNAVLKCKHCGEWIVEPKKTSSRFNPIQIITKGKHLVLDFFKPKSNKVDLEVGDRFFLNEIIKLKKGDEVFHETLGKGKVVKITVPVNLEESLRDLRGEIQFEHREDANILLLEFSTLRKLNSKKINIFRR